MKNYSIPCDKCGARLEGVPEFCANCGEKIASRLDPGLRDEIASRTIGDERRHRLLLFVYISAISLNILLIIISILVMNFYKPIDPLSPWGISSFIVFTIYLTMVTLLTAFDHDARVKGISLHLPVLTLVIGHAFFLLSYFFDFVYQPVGIITKLSTLISVPVYLIFATAAIAKAFKKPQNFLWAFFHILTTIIILGLMVVFAFLIILLVNLIQI